MTETAPLISGDELKAAAFKFVEQMRTRVATEQNGLLSVFDGWAARVVSRLKQFDASRSWEDSVRQHTQRAPSQDQGLTWDLMRLRLFLDRWRQGRFVDFALRERSSTHYHARFGTEFSADVLLTCQGAPSLMRWRGLPLMKNVFDFAIYPALIAELRPKTIFEIGSGSGSSALWLADTLTHYGIDGRVHSVDLVKAGVAHSGVRFYQGDCSDPTTLFDRRVLEAAAHPWLVVEDAHHNVAGVLEHFHDFLQAGDYLVVEDSDIKRSTLRSFTAQHPGDYLVDTRFTDNFGRNATCAADAIFVRTPHAGAGPVH